MNLGQIRSQVKTYLFSTSVDVNSLGWTDAELNQYINEAIFYIQQVSDFYMDTANETVVANQGSYDNLVNQDQFVRTTFDRCAIQQTNEYELDRDTNSSWRSTPAGQPRRFYLPQYNLLTLYPTPFVAGESYSFSSEFGITIEALNGAALDTATAFSAELGIEIGMTDNSACLISIKTDKQFPFFASSPDFGTMIQFATDEKNLSIIYLAIPDTLASDTDIPQLPAYSHFGAVLYATMRALAKEGEFQDFNLANQWFVAFSDWMEATLSVRVKEWPTKVRSLEPYKAGNIFSERLRNVGVPGCLQIVGGV